ncbi:hypothetical protein BHE74_00049122 [Ensete ventricosum]|nr:hypothetical protein BHE74_00049122 [Ensete ventricosum]
MAWPPTRGRPIVAKAPYKGAISYSHGPLQGGGWMLSGLATTATQKGQDGLRQSFCEKDNPTPLNSRNFKD